jgi:hypothetical protein
MAFLANRAYFLEFMSSNRYSKNYDFVPLPLPSHYRLWLALPTVHHREIIVKLPSLTVPNCLLPSFPIQQRPPSFIVLTIPYLQSPFLAVYHRPSSFITIYNPHRPTPVKAIKNGFK